MRKLPLITLWISAISVFGILLAAPQMAAAATTVKALGTSWFAQGANMPYLRYRCDFGCNANGGVSGNLTNVRKQLFRADRYHARVIRWYVFPGDAWQMRRDPDTNMPLGLNSKIYKDFDKAFALARKYDVYFNFVLFDDTRTIPSSWMADPEQRVALAAKLAPLFKRYSKHKHLLGWEIFNEPERGIDEAVVSLADARATIRSISYRVHTESPKHVSVGSKSVERLGEWTGLGLSFYSAHWFPAMTGNRCASCIKYSTLNTQYSLGGKPVVIGAFDTSSSQNLGYRRYHRLKNQGYAGAWAWSLKPTAHPARQDLAIVNNTSGWRFAYVTPSAGPRQHPLNPCLGPQQGALFCPNMHISKPSSLSLRGYYLLSANSINTLGRGPLEVRGTRMSGWWMRAIQHIHRVGGGTVRYSNGEGRLYFKAIPGQYRYWKYVNAARFELWQLDSNGRAVSKVRQGPKHIYCLRDLKHTRPGLRYSPPNMVYPGCSQNAASRGVTLGTSVGWSDVYPASYYEQGINVYYLRGCFALVHVVDPDNHLAESNEMDNRSAIGIRLPYRGNNNNCPAIRSTTNDPPSYTGN